MNNTLKKTLSLTAIATLQSFIFGGISYFQPTQAASLTEFDICIKELTTAGLTANQAAQACSKAFRPKELAYCINKVKFYTEVNAANILDNCSKVRRPAELADCVVDIRKKTENADPTSVMGYCRRSLLPQRFAQCVISMNKQGNVGVNESLDLCIKTKTDNSPQNLNLIFN